jgi:hypothetical protein
MALVVGGVASLALGSIWFLTVALLLRFVGTLIVVAFVFQLTTQVERPRPRP